MPKLVNLTPHPVTICLDDKCEDKVTIPPSGQVARVQQSREVVGYIEVEGKKILVVRSTYGKVEGLPPAPEPDTYYIVSLVVAQALANDPTWRDRILVPDTGPGSAIRDAQGNIIGVKYLMRL